MSYFEVDPSKDKAIEILKNALGGSRATTPEEAQFVDRASDTGAGKIESPDGLRLVNGAVI